MATRKRRVKRPLRNPNRVPWFAIALLVVLLVVAAALVLDALGR